MKKVLALLFTLILLGSVSVTAFAVDRPGGELLHKVEVTSYATGTAAKGTYVAQGQNVKLTASESSKYIFTGWVIDGKYEIISGSLTSKELVIKPLSDIKIEESYNVKGSKGFGKTNDSSSAPRTGNEALVVTTIIALGALSVMYASKKRVTE